MSTWWDTVQIGHKASVIGGLCAAVWITPWGAIAQDTDEPSGPKITFDVSQSIEGSDNFNLNADDRSGLRGVTGLGFGISSQTRRQSLSLQSNVSLRYGNLQANEDRVSDPNLTLNHTLQGANSRLTTRLRYSQADADSTFTQTVGPFELLLTDEGTRRNFSGSVGLELGIEGPIGASFEVSQDTINFSDTLDPDLFDTDTTTVSAALRFNLNDQLTARLSGNVSRRDTTGNGVDRDRDSVSLAVGYEISEALRTNASISYTTIDLMGGPATDLINSTQEGIGVSIGFEQDRPNGTISGTLSTDVGENGTRTSLNASRVFELPRAEMTLSFGLSKTEGIDRISPLFGIQYAQELKRGALNLSLSQSIGARPDNEEVRDTALSLAYNRELTALSSFDTTLSLRENAVLGSSEPDSSRLDLTLAYRRELAQDWDLVGSYTHAVSRSDDRDSISSNTISLGVQRSFDWFP